MTVVEKQLHKGVYTTSVLLMVFENNEVSKQNMKYPSYPLLMMMSVKNMAYY